MSSDSQKVMQSYMKLWHKYKSTLPNAEYYAVRDTLIDLPPTALLYAHCIFIIVALYPYTSSKHKFLKSIVFTFFVSFGGALVNAVLTATPSPLATEGANELVPVYLFVWWLVNCVPAVRYIFQLKLVYAPVVFLAHFAKVRAITATVHEVAARAPGGWAATILLGGIAGSGGVIFMDADKKFKLGPHTPSTFSAPEWGFKSAFLTAAVYYFLTDPHNLIVSYIDLPDINVGDLKFFLSMFLATLAVIEVLFGRSFNVFHYIERGLINVLGLKRSEYGERPTPALTDKTAKKTQ
eukprot:Plantae.Rhodophyta-Purpureofilum_apyrenoidigerum.ctg7979.p1 GENE.Plantae.Rhodophyta-Purpureofilum_apyrenoidigerum.ctg7979~~Plantae.Rhodophyta-Purpureofilum_apyrenoidigerum.ctg7979.p1  ORF type:complete len:294 (+),score=41.91 Plantae.Rhodophyta-Purpureofilum_apyrenoidigerum.ctg7979:155-1036(+)